MGRNSLCVAGSAAEAAGTGTHSGLRGQLQMLLGVELTLCSGVSCRGCGGRNLRCKARERPMQVGIRQENGHREG